mgnify:CR=1 FL=1
MEAEEIAENVAVEKATVDEENAAAKIEEDKCNKIATDVGEFKASAEADLAKAEPGKVVEVFVEKMVNFVYVNIVSLSLY